MKEMDILEMIGEARADYILDAQSFQKGEHNMRKVSGKKVWLIAAMVVLAMTLMGCTVAYAYAQGWFTSLYSAQNEQPLSDSQISYLDENEQVLNQVQTQNGWSVELRSAITDGTKGLIILGVTAPEGTNLAPAYGEDGTLISRLDMVGQWDKPIVYPDGFEEDVITWFFMDDGDGKTNTENFVIEVQPKPGDGSRNPFDPNAEWKLNLTDVIRITTDVDLLKEISDELGQYCYEGSVNTTEVLLDADWEFTFSFRAETAEETSREVLTAPVATKGQVYKRYGDGDGEYEYVLEDVTVTSVKLNALSATITYEFTGLYPAFEWDGNHVFAVMKDGTEIMLEDNWSRWAGYNVLKACSPIVVDEVDHIRLADGTLIYIAQ